MRRVKNLKYIGISIPLLLVGFMVILGVTSNKLEAIDIPNGSNDLNSFFGEPYLKYNSIQSPPVINDNNINIISSNYGAAAIWSRDKLDMDYSWELKSKIEVKTLKNYDLGDGLTFVLAKEGNDLGLHGAGLGVAGIDNGIALYVNYWRDNSYGLGVSTGALKTDNFEIIDKSEQGTVPSTNNKHTFNVSWNVETQSLTYQIGDYSKTIDLTNILPTITDSENKLRVGYSASTGKAAMLTDFTFNNFMYTSIDINAKQNLYTDASFSQLVTDSNPLRYGDKGYVKVSIDNNSEIQSPKISIRPLLIEGRTEDDITIPENIGDLRVDDIASDKSMKPDGDLSNDLSIQSAGNLSTNITYSFDVPKSENIFITNNLVAEGTTTPYELVSSGPIMDERLIASDANIRSTVAKNATKQDLITHMDALGSQNNIFIDLDVIANFDEINKGIVGTKHNVEFSMDVSGEISKVNVILTIIEDRITPDRMGEVNANLTLIHSSVAKNIENEHSLVQLMNVIATYDGVQIDPLVDANGLMQEINDGVLNDYSISFNIDADSNSLTPKDNASTIENLSVVSDNTVITPDKKGSVYAQNKQIRSTDAKNIATIDELTKLMKVKATYNGEAIIPNITTKEFAQIKAGRIGIYDVEFYITEGEGASKTVKLSIIEDEAIITPDDRGSVYANNMQITSTKVKEIEAKDELIKLMNAQSNYNGEVIIPNVSSKEFEKIKAGIIGIYDVEFYITEGEGASKTTKLSIIEDEAIITPDDVGSVYAKNNQVTSKRAKEIRTIDELIKLMNAEATYNGQVIIPKISLKEFEKIQAGIVGIYDVAFNIIEGDGASKTVKLSVIEDDAVTTLDNLGSVYAINKQITSTKAKSLKNKEDLIELMSVRATYDGSVIKSIVTVEDFKIINVGTIGIYDITFGITKEQEANKTVKLSVLNDDYTIIPDEKGPIYTSDIEFTSTKNSTYENEANSLMNSNVAYDEISIVSPVEDTKFNSTKNDKINDYDVSLNIDEKDTSTTNGKLRIVIGCLVFVIISTVYTIRKRRLS